MPTVMPASRQSPEPTVLRICASSIAACQMPLASAWRPHPVRPSSPPAWRCLGSMQFANRIDRRSEIVDRTTEQFGDLVAIGFDQKRLSLHRMLAAARRWHRPGNACRHHAHAGQFGIGGRQESRAAGYRTESPGHCHRRHGETLAPGPSAVLFSSGPWPRISVIWPFASCSAMQVRRLSGIRCHGTARRVRSSADRSCCDARVDQADQLHALAQCSDRLCDVQPLPPGYSCSSSARLTSPGRSLSSRMRRSIAVLKPATVITARRQQGKSTSDTGLAGGTTGAACGQAAAGTAPAQAIINDCCATMHAENRRRTNRRHRCCRPGHGKRRHFEQLSHPGWRSRVVRASLPFACPLSQRGAGRQATRHAVMAASSTRWAETDRPPPACRSRSDAHRCCPGRSRDRARWSDRQHARARTGRGNPDAAHAAGSTRKHADDRRLPATRHHTSSARSVAMAPGTSPARDPAASTARR
jgi:hypothetical protein